MSAKVRVEGCFVHSLEVFAIRVRDGDVVVELGAAEDEAFAPGGCFAQEALCIVGEDGKDEFVKGLGCAVGELLRLRLMLLVLIVRCCLQDNTIFAAA